MKENKSRSIYQRCSCKRNNFSPGRDKKGAPEILIKFFHLENEPNFFIVLR